MRIYVCWDTRAEHPLIGEHPCGVAYEAVRGAGWDLEVVRAHGWAKLPRALNFTSGRRQVRELTGKDEVPVLALDDGEVIAGTDEIVAWAQDNPAAAATS
jgi:hypothetical protein